jgi:hypothetical protein
MSSQTPQFPRFPSLPKEIRLIIWELSLTPQLISVTSQISPFIPHHAPRFLYFLGGDPPFQNFTLDDNIRPNEPYYTALSYPSSSTPPPLLSTCQESRAVALGKGYVSWKVANEHNVTEVREMMWNPGIDVIYFRSQEEERQLFRDEIDLFCKQFPVQAAQIQRLATVSSWWSTGAWKVGCPFMDPKVLLAFEELRDLVVVMDDKVDEGYMKRLGSECWEHNVEWMRIPLGLEETFDRERELVSVLERQKKEWGMVEGPRDSRIVVDEMGILSGYNLALEITKHSRFCE